MQPPAGLLYIIIEIIVVKRQSTVLFLSHQCISLGFIKTFFSSNLGQCLIKTKTNKSGILTHLCSYLSLVFCLCSEQ